MSSMGLQTKRSGCFRGNLFANDRWACYYSTISVSDCSLISVFLVLDVLSTITNELDFTTGFLGALNVEGLPITATAYGLSFVINVLATLLVAYRAWCVSVSRQAVL